ncbi:ISWI chromatin-remodeling complex ATPase ISW2-like [Helianthus annuus]|nr:ISWI chromatin-remodeling complex ATPase ISW2-like [Helianthus annuus]
MTKIPLTMKENTKPKKMNAHFYKKLFQSHGKKANVPNDTNDTLVEESCLVSRHKKQRLSSGQECGENDRPSGTKDKFESSSGELADLQVEVSTEIHNHVLPYVNKLRDHRNRRQNAVIFDGKDRLVKVVSFVLSLLDNTKKPILIIASSNAISLWEIEFSKRSKSVNVVTYKGNKDIRAAVIDSKYQVLLSSPDAIVEDMEMFDHKWELLVIDECQSPVFSTHFKEIRMLMADMRLLTVTGESVDILQSYRNFLSLVDCKNEKIHTDADMEMNDDISTLKKRLLPFIAFSCTFSTPEFEEYWVPVHLSSMQVEQYCSILVANLEALSSLSRKSSLPNIITQIQKCCDHPFLVDPTLRKSLKQASLTGDPLDAEINVSGKLQVLDKLLLEIKRCGLRALVLFQVISTGEFLDDLVHKRFGENSYVYISRKILSKSAYAKKEKPLEMFNDVESGRFVCLLDYHACHSSIRLSRVDVVILFNGDRNPSNDINALKRITIDSYCERLNVFRLYSAFTVEEKALILSKQGAPVVDNYISSSVGRQLLAWGAPYLFGNLKSSTYSGNQLFIDDLVRELSFLLRNTSVETGPANRSIVTNAKMQNGAYSGSIVLFGETEAHTKESSSVVEYLIANSPSDFWSNLVKESQLSPTNPCRKMSQRVKKPTQKLSEGVNQNDASTSVVRKKVRSKRKGPDKVTRKRAAKQLQSQTEGQKSQTDQPPPHTPTSKPLETEVERIEMELEQITKSHQEKKSMLLSECEKEMLEVQKKYDALIQDSETSLTKKVKMLEEYRNLVNVNKLLSEMFTQGWQDSLTMNIYTDSNAVKVLQIPASLHNRSDNSEPSLEPLPRLSTTQNS